jgi:uncharacterized protein involved in exopolysaccharide biosynthesis
MTREFLRTRSAVFWTVSLLVFIAGLCLAVTMGDVYRAQAVLTRPSGDHGPAVAGPDVASEVKSPAVMKAVARDSGELKSDAGPAEAEAAVEAVASRIDVAAAQTAQGDVEIRISVVGSKPEELANLANLTARSYVAACERSATASRQNLDRRKTKLAEMKADCDNVSLRADEAKKEYEAFLTKNVDILGGAATLDAEAAAAAIRSDLDKTVKALEAVPGEVQALEESEKLLRGRLKEVPETIEEKSVTSVPDPERVALERELRNLEMQREEMLKTYTPRHPDVVKILENIDTKRRQLKEIKDRTQDTVTNTRKPNPEYTLLKGRLDEVVVKLQYTKSSQKTLAEKRDALKTRVERVVSVTGEARRLSETETQAKKRAEELAAALRREETSVRAAGDSVGVAPKLLRPAEKPTVPVGPDRVMIGVLALLVGLVTGFLATAGSWLFGGVFAGPLEVLPFAGIPVAGRIRIIEKTPAAEGARRRRMKRAAALAAGLLVAVVLLAVAALR